MQTKRGGAVDAVRVGGDEPGACLVGFGWLWVMTWHGHEPGEGVGWAWAITCCDRRRSGRRGTFGQVLAMMWHPEWAATGDDVVGTDLGGFC
jgi:hypothetical protein